MNIHGGYLGIDKEEVLDFSVNINPVGFPEKIKDVIVKHIDDAVDYPEIDGETSRKSLANKINVLENNIILGNGATELIYLFARSIKADKVLIVEPTFTEYERAFTMYGAQIYSHVLKEDKNFKINGKKLIQCIEEINPNVVVICNPNNPTAKLVKKDIIEEVAEKVKSIGSYLFIDESFLEFTDFNGSKYLIEKFPVFIIHSLTKYYAIAGLRIGYGIGSRDLINKLNEYKEPWTMNTFALLAVKSILHETDHIEKSNEWYNGEKQYLYSELVKIPGLKVYNSSANFFLGKFEHIKAITVNKKLIQQGINLRLCNDFKGLNDYFFRVAIRSRKDNDKLIKALKDILRKVV